MTRHWLSAAYPDDDHDTREELREVFARERAARCDCESQRHALDCPRRHERARWVAPGGDDVVEAGEND